MSYKLDHAGVRAVRFNLKRGRAENVSHLDTFAKRIHALVRWHVELYIDSKKLAYLYRILIALPAISIDHLGLSREGFPELLKLAEKGAKVKATGFNKVDFNVKIAVTAQVPR